MTTSLRNLRARASFLRHPETQPLARLQLGRRICLLNLGQQKRIQAMPGSSQVAAQRFRGGQELCNVKLRGIELQCGE